MLTQNFWVTNKEHYGMLWHFWSGQLHDWFAWGTPTLFCWLLRIISLWAQYAGLLSFLGEGGEGVAGMGLNSG